jgi:hypothetical protein
VGIGGFLLFGVKRVGSEAKISAEVKRMLIYTSTSPYYFIAKCLINKYRVNFLYLLSFHVTSMLLSLIMSWLCQSSVIMWIQQTVQLFLIKSKMSLLMYSLLMVGKSKGTRPLGSPRCRWLYNIKMDLGEIGWSSMDCIGLAQRWDQWKVLTDMAMNIQVP